MTERPGAPVEQRRNPTEPRSRSHDVHIQVVQLGHLYEGSRSWAVHDLDLEIFRGEFIGLLGPSGCGKTTTLLMIAGLVEPTTGTVKIDGRDMRAVPAHRRPATMVFQNYALFPHLTVAENIAYGPRVHGWSASRIASRVDELLSLVSLPSSKHKYPTQLSGGEQQRVAIARALALAPDVVLLDEPLSNLDARLRRTMRAEIRRILRTAGVTAIFVTHDQAEALSLCDRIVLMFKGVAVHVADPQELYGRPASREAAEFLGDVNALLGVLTEVGSDGHGRAEFTLGHRASTIRVLAPGARRGERGTVLVRPENVRVMSRTAGTVESGIVGVVRRSDYQGYAVDYVIDVGDLELTSKVLGSDHVLPAGTDVEISFAEDGLTFIPSSASGGPA